MESKNRKSAELFGNARIRNTPSEPIIVSHLLALDLWGVRTRNTTKSFKSQEESNIYLIAGETDYSQ